MEWTGNRVDGSRMGREAETELIYTKETKAANLGVGDEVEVGSFQ